MRYVAMREHGGPDVLYVAEAPKPQPAPGEVLIEVEAAGVARPDALQRAGAYPAPPGASPNLGLEVSGVIEAVGRDVVGLRAGDPVVALCNGGGYSEFVSVPAGQVLPLPSQWSFVEGATLPENAFTVFDNLLVRARLREGEMVLVHGGTSGIGTMATQMARAAGATVIATVGSDEKCAAAIRVGASFAINYHTSDFVKRVHEITEGRGVDVVLDIVGGDYIDRDLRALAVEGRVSCLATGGGAIASIDLRYLLQRRATILGSSLRPRNAEEKAEIAHGLRSRIWPLLPARDPISPVIDSLFTFSQAAQAHERLESHDHIGKIVLVPDAPAPP